MLKIKKQLAKQEVYDITVKDNNNFFANNILVHNCVEITLPTAELTRSSRMAFDKDELVYLADVSPQNFRDEYGEIALCTLSSLNWGAISEPADFEKPCELAIRALDELLDYQDYPMIAAGIPAIKRRSLGVGMCNLAYFIAKHDMKYSDSSANDVVNRYAEAMSYYLIKASMELAKEKGACDWFNETKYSKGILPIHTYKKDVDKLLDKSHYLDWDSLIADVKKYGMRNSTVMALMPVESSSQPINATNGMEAPRSAVSIKASKDGTLKQVVPEIHGLKNKYEYLWDMPHTRGTLELAAIFQKWTDQAISTNTSYNPENYEDNKVPMSELIKDLVYAYKLGLKTLYYQNTHDGSGDVYDDEDCAACKL